MTGRRLTPQEHVFVVNARQYWPNETVSDATLLDLAKLVCMELEVSDFDDTASAVRGMMPDGTTIDQAVNFTITAVMNVCPVHDPQLPRL